MIRRFAQPAPGAAAIGAANRFPARDQLQGSTLP